MDPVTQTVLGAGAALAVARGSIGRRAAWLGAVGGELPDADVFLPPLDPALPIELHRHFTHALVFIPVGGLLATLPFLAVPRWRRDFRAMLLAATVGCATHGLLDSCTSYGTHLLWPFSSGRVAWDVISIIDPIFTLALAIGLVWALLRDAALPARLAIAVALGYLGLGVVQHGRASAAQARLADDRGDVVERGRVMPTLGNLVVWRSLYECDGVLHADRIRAGVGAPEVTEGTTRPRLRFADLPDEIRDVPRVRRVFDGFALFADDFVGPIPHASGVILGDARYSLDPAGFDWLWGVEISTDEDRVTLRWLSMRRIRERAEATPTEPRAGPAE